MVGTLKLKEENKIKKLGKIAETRMAVYIYIYIIYCHLENKKLNLQNAKNNFNLEILKLNNKSKDRTILRLDMDRNIKSFLKNSYFSSIGLSFCAF